MRHVTIAFPDELSAALLLLVKICPARPLRPKSHGVELEYTLEDIERDRETHRQLGL